MKQNRSFQNGLRKWINGNIRAKEEAQLDKISQEDDFARDALEGLRSFSETDHNQHLTGLRKQLQKKNKSAVILPLMVRRIAAAILFLAVVGTTWWLNQPNNSSSLTMDQLSTPEQEARPPATEDAQIAEEETAAPELNTEKETGPLPEPKTKIPERKAAPSPSIAPPVNTDHTILEEEVAAVEEILADEAPPAIVHQEDIAAFRSKSQAKSSPQEAVTSILPQAYEDLPIQTINGRVLDPAGQPVAGALIRDLSNQQETRSDFAGNFSIPQQLASKAAGVQVSHFNYADTTIQVKMDQALEINLKNRSSATVNDTQQPYPAGGFSYFQEQPDKSAKKRASQTNRSAALEAPIGTTIRFTVYADGSIGNFQVVDSPDKKSERNALKQLKQGPKWILPAGLDSLDTQITLPMLR